MCCLMIFQNISITLELLDCITECIREQIRTDAKLIWQSEIRHINAITYQTFNNESDQNCWVLFCLRGFEFWEKPVECRVVEVQWIMRAKQDWILCNQTNFTTNGQPFGIRVGSGCDYHRHDHCDHHLCQHHQHYQGREHDLSRDFLLTKADTESWNCGNYKKRSNHQFIKCPFI